MKRFIFSVFVFTLSTFHFASAANAAESIPYFHVVGKLFENRSLSIVENIRYDFGDAERHGIYRFIPERYFRNGARYDLRLDIGKTTMDGPSMMREITRDGDNRKIRIGNPDKTVTDIHEYSIAYKTTRAVNDFPEDGERELYWNVTGNSWDVPIGVVTMELVLPAAPTKTVCFLGVFGSTEEKDCRVRIDGLAIIVEALRPLQPGEGLTFAVRIPQDSMQDVSAIDHVKNFIQDNIWVFTPLLVLLAMLYFWWNYGRDPKGRGTVIAEYEEPDNLPPGLQVSLLDQTVPPKAITATLLDLARRGYAKIRFEGDPNEKGWFKPKAKMFYEKVKEPVGLSVYEKTMFDGIFSSGDSVDLSERHESFWQELQKARKQIFDELQEKNYFGTDPSIVRFIWIALALGCVVFSFFMISVFGELFIVSGILSGLIVLLFGWHMPRVTKEGAVMVERIQGFKKFLSVTEKDRLAFTDAPAKQPEQFARFLPAAVAFGVEDQWAEHFANLQLPKPSYVDGNVSSWSAVSYAHAMHSFHHSSSSSMYSAPSSSGSGGSGFSGGGSGGGGGGGGGGSW